jgi:uncharacterized membrane protein
MLRQLLIVFSMLLALASPAAALGISPGRLTVDWQPGLQQQVDVVIFNNGAETNTFELQAEGEVGNWLTLTISEVTLAAGDNSRVTAMLKLPDTLKPGTHKGGIIAVEKLPSAGVVGAKLGVESQVWVTVPYPPRWMDVKLEFSNQTGLAIYLSNPATETVSSSVKVDVQRDGQTISSVDKGTVVLASGEGRNLDTVLSWDAGNYTVTATLQWDGGSNDDRIEFDLSEPVKPIVPPTRLPVTLIMAGAAALLLVAGGLMLMRSEKRAKKR